MLNTIHISSFRCDSHLATVIIERRSAIQIGICGLRMKTAIRRGLKGGKVIEETFTGKLKDGVTAKRQMVP